MRIPIRFLAGLFFLLAFSAASLYSATPGSGTLAAPANGSTSTVSWSGGPITGAGSDNTTCTQYTCDTFALTLAVPASFYSTNPNYAVHVQISWSNQLNDFDLYLLDSSGNVVGSSTQGPIGTSEFIDAGQLPPGNYSVVIVASSVVNSTYSGSADVSPEPTSPSGRARYRRADFSFATAYELQRPSDPENSTSAGVLVLDQDVEPRILSDALGNLYVAAIQGVPGGSDVWKSSDGGQTFTYLGEPDGAQMGSSLAPGEGVGGGDEDLAIGTSGNVYVTSLWLGAATQSSSFDGGTLWSNNPAGSDIPGDDRQWIASQGDKILYMTYKQLGADLNGTDSIIVVKSFDGGLTFPQVSQATTAELGVQPGDQGNIVVDPNNGNVYTVFIDQNNSNQVYMARSTDGGLTWILKLVYQAATQANLANVFPIIAADRGSNLHIVFSDGHSIYLTSSANQGASWTLPVRVSNGASTKTALQPWVDAESSGKLNITWIGTPSSDSMSTTAQWQVFLAQTQNAFANVPVFTEMPATGVMHVGPVCVNGLGCASGTRNLAEYFVTQVNLSGNAMIVYPDDKNSNLPSGAARTWFIQQKGGSTIISPN